MNQEWLALKDHLLNHTGLSYYQNREEQLLRAIGPCMEAARITSYESYLAHLRTSPEEVRKVVSRLTVGETYFFRDRPQFQALLDTVLPSLAESALTRRPRAWSAGCSIGAEPYSLSCLAYTHFRERLHPLSILATDINVEVVEMARNGVFSDWALRQVQPSERERYFISTDRGEWRLRTHLRENVEFQCHNLASDPIPPGGQAFDLILCRNVLIYFDQHLIRRVLDQFYDALRPGGWLGVGYSEHGSDIFHRFEVVSRPGTVMYRRPLIETTFRQASPPVMVEWPPPAPDPPVPVAWLKPPLETPPSIDELKSLADGGQWQRARELADELLARDPLHSRAHFYRALVHEHLGDTEGSAKSYRQAIYLDRADSLPHYYWGLAQMRAGRHTEAAKSFRTVVRLIDSLDVTSQASEREGITLTLLRAQALTRLKELSDS